MKTIKSDLFRYSDALENEFKRELRRELVAPMIKTTTKTILDLYRKNKAAFKMEVKDAAAMDANAYDIIDRAIKRLGKRFYDLYIKKGAELSQKAIMRQYRFGRSVFTKIINKMMPKENEIPLLKGSAIPRDMANIIKTSTKELQNYTLDIQNKYFTTVNGAVFRSMQSGGSIKQLTMEIYKAGDETYRRAELIAEDQTRKAYMFITARNMAKAGIKKAEWVHSGGGTHAREYHIHKWDGTSGKTDGRPNGLNGFIFDIDKPPVIQKKQGKQEEVRGFPAQLPNCRCVMRAVVELDDI